MGEIHKNMNSDSIIFLAVDCVLTELPKEVGNVSDGAQLYELISQVKFLTQMD
jgi:hypothetical protein